MNPFNKELDWALRGKYVEVITSDHEKYRGWLNRIHHSKGSVLLHSAQNMTTEATYGSVFVRMVNDVRVIRPQKKVDSIPVHLIRPSPHHDMDFEPDPDVVNRVHRNLFAGSWPVVRDVHEGYEIINGHKRIEACRVAGVKYHPVEIVHVSDETAKELYELAHD